MTRQATALGVSFKPQRKKHLIHTLSPTFGRDYNTRDEILHAWEQGVTFKHTCPRPCEWTEDYGNNVTLNNHSTKDGVQLQYMMGKLSTLWMPEELSVDDD